jgi:hypothetical protein
MSHVRMIQLGAACLFYFLAELVVAALFPVLRLASWPTVACAAAAAFLSRRKAKRGCAGGALREEDHWGSVNQQATLFLRMRSASV